MADTLLEKVKKGIRRSHDKLDDDLLDDIHACLADLGVCGVAATTSDPLIINAVKLYCRSTNTDDPAKSAEWLRRYESLKASLMMASEYNGGGAVNE